MACQNGSFRADTGQSRSSIGAILPMSCEFTRNTADAVVQRHTHLAYSAIGCSISIVVAAPPQWAETHSLIRYPSPYGRSCTFLCRPPFFLFNRTAYRNRRGIAQSRGFASNDFDQRSGMTFTLAITFRERVRCLRRCVSRSFSCYPSWRSPALQPAVTRLANKPLSVLAPARARHLWSAETLPVARLSAPGRTSPTARHSRVAARNFTHLITGAVNLKRTIGADRCAGGFFVSNSARYGARQNTVRGDDKCLVRF